MKKLIHSIRNKVNSIRTSAKTALASKAGEGYIDTGVKIIIGVVVGGVIENVDVWGKRRLAYAINYETEGYYVLVNFEADSKVPAELDRVFNITTGVLRSMIIKK